VIAIDASPDALCDGSWRAHRWRLANVAFLVTSLEQLPRALEGIAHEVTVHFPWGSLLVGLLEADPAIVGPLASALRPNGELRLLISAVERDGYDEVTPAWLNALAPRYGALGLALTESRWATADDYARSRSSWAKRLGPRPAVFAAFRRHSRFSSRSGRTSEGTPRASHGLHSTSNHPS
jgi:hypothetical protein